MSNMLVTGEDLVRPAAELQQQLLSMTHTGDTGNRAEKALAILNGWCDGIGREQGELDTMRQQETRLAGQLSELERLSKEIQIQKENCRKLGQQAAKAQDAYETAHTQCETQIADTETRRHNMREDREQRIQEIKKRMPDEGLVRKAGEAL